MVATVDLPPVVAAVTARPVVVAVAMADRLVVADTAADLRRAAADTASPRAADLVRLLPAEWAVAMAAALRWDR